MWPPYCVMYATTFRSMCCIVWQWIKCDLRSLLSRGYTRPIRTNIKLQWRLRSTKFRQITFSSFEGITCRQKRWPLIQCCWWNERDPLHNCQLHVHINVTTAAISISEFCCGFVKQKKSLLMNLEYFSPTATNEYCIHEEIKNRLNSGMV
jgi:hypothetical protein